MMLALLASLVNLALLKPVAGVSAYELWQMRANLQPDPSVRVVTSEAAMIIVDMQRDFVGEWQYSAEEVAAGESPCSGFFATNQSCFGVPGGSIVSDVIGNMLGAHRFKTVVASMDDHAPDHCSFLARSGGKIGDAPSGCAPQLGDCDPSAFHGCRGTEYMRSVAPGNKLVAGPFPPHCVRGKAGSRLFDPLQTALLEYAGDKHVAIKGLDTSTDSFGVFPYTRESWGVYRRAGLLETGNASHVVPAVLMRSMLTWEKHMAPSTGASSYIHPFPDYAQLAPPFSAKGEAGAFKKAAAADIIRASRVTSLLVTGLALDWCVLDTAVNAKVLFPHLDVFIVLDAARPPYLPKANPGVAPYLKQDVTTQCWNGTDAGGTSGAASCWLHDPSDVAAVLRTANIRVINSAQLSATPGILSTKPDLR